MLSTREKVSRMLNYVFGCEYGDGEIVTAVIDGYAEPGYGNVLSDETPVVVLGNWNAKRYPRDNDAPLTAAEDLPPRLAEALERLGAEIEWLDEWTECRECYRALRTTGDSYHWKPAYVWSDDGPVCHECAIEAGDAYLEDYVNDPHKCVTWCEPSHIEKYRYVKWEPSEPHTYESGWHAGQTDDSEVIHGEILESHPDAEVLFFLDESSQFYIRFSAYVRVPE